MIPASFANSLPVSNYLDPFEIYFILPKKIYKKNFRWINRLNGDSSLTAGVFSFKVYPRELIFEDNHNNSLRRLLERSNVIARVLHPDENTLHVEHQILDIENRDEESFRNELKLFILQLCRANLDETRQMLYFNSNPSLKLKDSEINSEEALLNLEELFEKLVCFFSPSVKKIDNQRLRDFKSYKPAAAFGMKKANASKEQKFNHLTQDFPKFLQGYEVTKEKELRNLKFKQNEDGTISLNQQNAIKILIELGLIQKPSGLSPLASPENVKIVIKPGIDYPVLEIHKDSIDHSIELKGTEGPIIFIATLLKRKFQKDLKRTEVTNIFKEIKKNKDICRSNILDFIPKKHIPAFNWIAEIYIKLYGKNSLNTWCFRLYNNCEDPTKQGVSNLKRDISKSLDNVCLNILKPYVNIESTRNSRNVTYSIGVHPDNIFIDPDFNDWIYSTQTYLSELERINLLNGERAE